MQLELAEFREALINLLEKTDKLIAATKNKDEVETTSARPPDGQLNSLEGFYYTSVAGWQMYQAKDGTKFLLLCKPNDLSEDFLRLCTFKLPIYIT